MKKAHFFAVLLLFFSSLHSADFSAVWAYVLKGEEKALRPSMSVTDVAYFAVRINEIGEIASSFDQTVLRPRLPEGARVHCVVACPHNASLLYWCLGKDPSVRQALLDSIVALSSDFDGLQIDFESVRSQDRDAFLSFLRDIRSRLPEGKIFSVCVPARTVEKKDAYPYAEIAKIADRVLVMAYDEHWRTGSPGAIASLPWCKKVCAFAQKNIPPEKLILGLPLYGRVWQTEEISRALKYPQTLDLWKEVRTSVARQEDGTPFFSFEKTIRAEVFFEDALSLTGKLAYYEEAGVREIGLWRLSQEPAALWENISTQKAGLLKD